MIACNYVGGDASSIGDREFDEVGQRAVFSEEGYREAVLGNAAFIPEYEFRRIEFTPEQLAAHGPVATRVDPPQSFCDKLARAQQVFRDIRDRMLEEGVRGQQVLADISEGNIQGE